jgi:uncharacterized protein DUF222/HNH endonuclease
MQRHEIDALGDRIAEIAVQLDVGTHTLLTALREFDEADGWGRQGALTCAQWLSWRIGMGLGMARERMRIAHALAKLPLVDAAMARGELSYTKVRAITRTATAATEAALVEMARCSTAAQLEKICRRFREIDPSAEAARAREEQRGVWIEPTDDGLHRVVIALMPEEAARLMTAIEGSGDGKMADRAVAMAECVLRGSAGDRAPTEVVVHVDAATLTGELEDGTGVSAEVARRLCCDGGLVTVIEDAKGKTLDVGRKTRTIPAAILRALRMRDGGCRFPGCCNRVADAHHVRHWVDGGETKLENLVLICRRHHRYLHELGFSIVEQEGELLFLDPDGEEIPRWGARAPMAYDCMRRMREQAAARGLRLTAHTATPRWHGDAPNYDACIQALDSAERRHRAALPR